MRVILLSHHKAGEQHSLSTMLRLRCCVGRAPWRASSRLGTRPGAMVTRALSESGRSVVSVENQRQILQRCEELQGFLQPVNDRLRGPLEKNSDKAPLLPFVFLLGNHSSGKSSFINYVMGRKIQTAGVAPTDDSFTIIAPGPTDIDQDGPALIGDPDMGFSGLRHFGPDLIHHTQLKIRRELAAGDFMMVDSPGMIDSPVNPGDQTQGTIIGSRRRHMDRGYDFEGVCKWFAERADVILLFFDPDKPGTTGETLSILTKSLAGMDHKLYIVLNKADQFRKIHDFARAYGSLCWNLSKVIPRKDLPRIYTMYLPVQYQKRNAVDGASPDESQSLGQGLQDLEKAREEVVDEVMKAPKRRIDNVITRLADSVHLVQMHATVLESVRSDFSRELWTLRMMGVGVASAGMSLLAGCLYMELGLQPTLALAGLYTAGSGGLLWYNDKLVTKKEEEVSSLHGLETAFRRLYARQLAEGDEFVNSLWKRTVGPLKLAVTTQGLAKVEKVSNYELKEMQRILDEEIPRLRRLAAPVQWNYRKGEKGETTQAGMSFPAMAAGRSG